MTKAKLSLKNLDKETSDGQQLKDSTETKKMMNFSGAHTSALAPGS